MQAFITLPRSGRGVAGAVSLFSGMHTWQGDRNSLEILHPYSKRLSMQRFVFEEKAPANPDNGPRRPESANLKKIALWNSCCGRKREFED